MLRYILKHLASLILSLAVASLIIFAVIEVAPGDPASFMLGINAQPETLDALRRDLGLDVSKTQRYLNWVTGMLTGDFGTSYTYRTSVTQMVADRISVSIPLALYALLLSIFIAIPAGIYAAARRGQAGDVSVMATTQLGIALPNFWFAMMLVLVFAINLRWFPAGGFAGWDKGLLAGLTSLTLPAIALALPQAAILTRVMRSALLDVLGEDFMRTARAKGLSARQTLWRHGLRNAMIPVLTIIGLQFSFLFAGTIIIEQVFYLPGLGRLIFQSISARDLIVVESVVMLVVFGVIMINFLVDLTYAIVDPRLRART
ncbi:ABC transporter permease [Roseobacter sp.]|uniref:ABC transporter permease n=1 Tax=Roseobacter sp. TaxID=1907202 RepID=UPI0032991512